MACWAFNSVVCNRKMRRDKTKRHNKTQQDRQDRQDRQTDSATIMGVVQPIRLYTDTPRDLQVDQGKTEKDHKLFG